MIQPASNGLYHPASEDEIVELINYAIENKLQVRVRGAAQSAGGSIFADGFDTTNGNFGKNINIELDQMRAVIYEANMQVRVGGGCNLGFDPFDPSETSQESNSNNLFFQLNQQGLAIPNVPGAIHQTIAGFISTGSSGGTMQHSFDECILAIRLVDGTGKKNIFTKSENLDDPFYGIPVSMGLLGIITEVTLQCVPAFQIIGDQSTTHIDESPFDFFGPGTDAKPSLENYIRDNEFSRTLWWPITSLKRTINWKARKMKSSDYNASTGTPTQFTAKPFKPMFPTIAGSTLPSEEVAVTGFQLIASWPDWIYNILGKSSNEAGFFDKALVEVVSKLFPYFYPLLTDFYFPVNTPINPPQVFWDQWLSSLPMDKVEYSSNLFQLAYCEIWVSADLTNKLVNAFQKDYDVKGYSATGFYTVEILGAKKSDCWLSPAYGTDSVRINILYFQKSAISPADYFKQFWKLLSDNQIPYRAHWGKALPDDTNSSITASFPKWNEWNNLRATMDPHQLFVNDYWRKHLEIPPLQ